MTDEITITAFRQTVWDFFNENGRHDLPWRLDTNGQFDPHGIMVSEIMLQQTQVARVITKFNEFLTVFPDVQSLAAADIGSVLRLWTGLGYNRRAKFIHQAAQRVITDYNAVFPRTIAELVALPGIGVNTAGAIAAYAWNLPVVFVETNIRTVMIHHFFDDAEGISDKQIAALTEQTLDLEQPREWYWALMDYGSFLKQTVGNLNRQSKTYNRQSTFAGSKRQIRGQVIKLLAQNAQPLSQLAEQLPDDRLPIVVDELLAEGLIRIVGKNLSL